MESEGTPPYNQLKHEKLAVKESKIAPHPSGF